ncbi:hypothetical protein FB45DRAFT_1034104 [Roridomyces roridus]|uniref:Uncharacterized protein n=1 Tax=Roridomyces roridus TaxID=1738132 RepID=A0AAD7FDQ6_9AGAR|nr:hypothetical protein FB45DRAFT_1034104 [Roridomyces roridus]
MSFFQSPSTPATTSPAQQNHTITIMLYKVFVAVLLSSFALIGVSATPVNANTNGEAAARAEARCRTDQNNCI